MRAAVPVALGVFTYGVVFGALANQVGVTSGENLLMNVIVFAGAAQTAALDSWSYPLPVLSIVFTVLLINLRLILLGAAIRPWLAGLPAKRVYPMLHIMSDEAWAVAMSLRRRGERDAGVFLGCNLMVALAWIVAIVIGHVAGGQIGDPAAIGLDFAFTLVFAAMLFGSYRGRFDLLPWTVAGLSAWIGYEFLPGTWYVVLGGVAGCLAGALRQLPAGNA
jgi:4-azaleucine resistance transporter AzlC